MKVRNILISQPKPADLDKSPYTRLVERYNINIQYKKFITIEGIGSKEFRQNNKINLADYTAIILTSRQAVDHYFRIAKELRYSVPESMKYFCISESTALYLQKYVQYRKRKIFHGQQKFAELMDVMKKFNDEKYLYPCSEIHKNDIPDLLSKNDFDFDKAVLFRTKAADLSKLDLSEFEMLVFFSPSGVKSLFTNFPEYKQNGTVISTFGATTTKAAKQMGLKVNIEAPTAKFPSMYMAIDSFIKEQRKRKR